MEDNFVTFVYDDGSPCILRISRIKEVKEYTSSLTKIFYGEERKEVIVKGDKLSAEIAIKEVKEKK